MCHMRRRRIHVYMHACIVSRRMLGIDARFICVYMYACMHVCMYACMHVCMHACTLSRRMLGRRRIHLSYEEEEDTCMYACMYFVAQDAGKEEDTFVI